MKQVVCILIPLLFLLLSVSLFAQGKEKVWVVFSDKPYGYFDPGEYFDPHSVQRRVRQELPLYDETDLPVSVDYIRRVEAVAGRVVKVSRWLNAVTVYAGRKEQEALSRLPFVTSIEPVLRVPAPSLKTFRQEVPWLGKEEELAELQLAMLEGDVFDSLGLDGRGVRIAVFDAGFPEVDNHPLFAHIREEGRIVATHDFIKGKDDVFAGNVHGTMVLSCIAGINSEWTLGLATGAEFLLARTEQWGEPFSEEENWVCAMEWADRYGADIISSSLGYTYHRYFPDEMNGRVAMVSRAATLAAKKGILVVNAMGNSGASRWEILGAPADADSILSVGGVDPFTGRHMAFSSFGPSADGRLKPNVCAPAQAAVAGKKKVKTAYGTSFSTPLVTGFAACVRQMHPEWNNLELLHAIERSGHLYPYYDYAHGYGIPQASYFTAKKKDDEPLFTISADEEKLAVQIRKMPGDSAVGIRPYLYYHIAYPGGLLKKYAVIEVTDSIPLVIPAQELNPDDILRVYYGGQTRCLCAENSDL
ncbi:MAG: S8 family serine peptidase [Bacteroidales bacterium]